jgi:hypothetical protein
MTLIAAPRVTDSRGDTPADPDAAGVDTESAHGQEQPCTDVAESGRSIAPSTHRGDQAWTSRRSS